MEDHEGARLELADGAREAGLQLSHKFSHLRCETVQRANQQRGELGISESVGSDLTRFALDRRFETELASEFGETRDLVTTQERELRVARGTERWVRHEYADERCGRDGRGGERKQQNPERYGGAQPGSVTRGSQCAAPHVRHRWSNGLLEACCFVEAALHGALPRALC